MISTAAPVTPTTPTSSSGMSNNPLSIFTKEFNMYKGEHYHFYCMPEGGGQPPTLYQDILKQVEHKVFIWDPYFGKDDARVFGELTHSGVEIRIITEKTGGDLEVFKNNCVTEMETVMPVAIRTGCTLKVTHPKNTLKDWQTHDRFLLVDDRVFLIGSSVNYYTSQQKSTGACEVISAVDKELIQKSFDYFWIQLDNGSNVASHSF